MKKHFTTGAALVLFAAAGMLACTKEPLPDAAGDRPEGPVTGRYVSFVAGTPEAEAEGSATSGAPATRAGYESATGNAVWDAGDRIGIFVKGSENKNLPFAQKAGTLSADRRKVEYEGTFLSPVSGTQTVYAVYPYDPDMDIFVSKVEMHFPARQVYTPGGYTGIPLFGKYEGDMSGLQFKHFMNPFAMVELRLASEEPVKVTRIVFQGNNGEKLSGTIEMDMSGSRPAVSYYSYDASSGIVLDCGQGVELSTTPKSFYIAIPVQEYAKGYRFDIRTDREGANGIVLHAKSGGITPVANTIYGTPVQTLTAAQYKYIVPDAKFRTWLATNGWVSIDDEVSGAVTVLNTTGTSMDCRYGSISSLEGIEYFPQLTTLDCSNNQLAVLDVTKHTGLIYLYCSANMLSALDVSASTALVGLFCADNRLAVLDVSANTLLTSLGCTSNELTALDVSANTELVNLLCGKNDLSELDVSANTALVELDCNSNRLAVLDVSANTLLTSLACTSNELTALDVSANTALVGLFCADNRLAVLDVTANTLLKSLTCYGNRLTQLDIAANTALQSLTCYGNRLTSLNATTMAMPASYILYCGNQTDAAGNAVTLQLSLSEAQRNRWETMYAGNRDNSSVSATFVP